MKPGAHKAIDKHRIREGQLASDERSGNNGAFMVPYRGGASGVILAVVVSDGDDWDHVSVSLQNRCPTWDEMCWIKAIFF